MASTSRRAVLKVSDQNVKLTTHNNQQQQQNIIQKSMPAILSRKRKSDQLDMDLHDWSSPSSSPWSMLASDLDIFQISNSIKSSRDEPSSDDLMTCFENMPPSKVEPMTSSARILGNKSSNTATRMPLATLSSNVNRPLQQQNTNVQKVTIVAKPKPAPLNTEQQTPKAPPAKKLRLSHSWSQFREFVRTSSTDSTSSRLGSTPLPEVRWADKQEVWNLICKKERGMYLRQTGEELLARHPCLQPRMRAILFDWLVEVCEVYRLHRQTFYLAVDFIDRYLGSTTNLPKTRVQLIGVTCLFIAAKIEEIYPPKLQEFAYVTDGACSEEEILAMELIILKGLNWGLSPMTPNSWVKLYLQVNETTNIVETTGSLPPENEDFILPQYSGKKFSKVMQLLDLCILDIGSLSFPYSVLSASAVYHCQDQQTALQASGYTWDEISSCVSWMASFVFALREMSPASVVSAKPMSNISADDIDNIQVHSIELAILDRAQQRQAALQEEEAGRISPEPTSTADSIYSSVEMTPPVEPGCLYKQTTPNNNTHLTPVSQSSSVFMTPKSGGDSFW